VGEKRELRGPVSGRIIRPVVHDSRTGKGTRHFLPERDLREIGDRAKVPSSGGVRE